MMAWWLLRSSGGESGGTTDDLEPEREGIEGKGGGKGRNGG